jgi:ribosomal protein L18E
MEGSEQIPDRNALKEKIITCIDPEQHPADGVVNIVTGKVTTDPKVNVQAITIATSAMKKFEAGWPASFHAPIHESQNNGKGIHV